MPGLTPTLKLTLTLSQFSDPTCEEDEGRDRGREGTGRAAQGERIRTEGVSASLRVGVSLHWLPV